MPEAATRRFIGMLEAPDETWVDKQVEAFAEFAELKFERKQRIPESEVGLAGMNVLGEAGAPALPQLVQMLDSGERRVVSRAITAMTFIGQPAVPALTNAIRHTNELVRVDALFGLETVVPRSAVVFESALHLLGTGSQRERWTAAHVIASTTNDVERAWRITKELLGDRDLSVRRSALYGLRFFGDRPLAMLPHFASQLRSNTVLAEVRTLSTVLGRLTNHSTAIVECLIEGLQTTKAENRIPMLFAIERLGPPTERILPIIEPLYLNAPTGAYRQALARTLKTLAPDAAARLNVQTNFLPQGQESSRRGRR
jgi:hypothetical protein